MEQIHRSFDRLDQLESRQASARRADQEDREPYGYWTLRALAPKRATVPLKAA